MSLLYTVLAFLVAIGLLIVVHELGHYFAARLCNVKVLRFSLGMGKILYSRRFGKDQTEWAVSMLPLGGYVKLLDSREVDLSTLPPEEAKREFNSQSVWKRMVIVAAGPLANFLLAIVLLMGLYMNGVPGATTRLRAVPENSIAWQAGLRGGELVTAVNGEPVLIWSELNWKLIRLAIERSPIQLDVLRHASASSAGEKATVMIPAESVSNKEIEKDFLRKLGLDLARPPAQLGKVIADGPAMGAGLREGDVILAVNGKPVIDGLDFVETVRNSPGKPLAIRLQRDRQTLETVVTPEKEMFKEIAIGKIRVEIPLRPELAVSRSSFEAAFLKATQRTWDTSVVSLKIIAKMLIGEVSWKNISGPITIADYAGQSARVGAISYLAFIAFISISLGVMNLLPIPVLDGGLLLYYSLELLTGRPLSERAGKMAQRAGIAMLAALMIIAIFNDIVRLVF
ncbi:MAG: RIP metalloprotease RseP [Oxalobacter sp.]|nr:MAG: RIP metalloprotease RseP [Oxalobacter sp.]